jgi:hypothetical protein
MFECAPKRLARDIHMPRQSVQPPKTDMTDEILFHRGTTHVRRQRLAPGEALPWHRDPFHRVGVVLAGDQIAIEFRDGSETRRVPVKPGQVGWDEPSNRPQRAVNVGQESYEEITIFFLDYPDAVPQPQDD